MISEMKYILPRKYLKDNGRKQWSESTFVKTANAELEKRLDGEKGPRKGLTE